MSESEKTIAAGDERTIKQASARHTRRSFVVGSVAAAAGYGLWKLIDSGQVIGRQPVALRRTFQTDAAIARGVFDERGLAPEYPLAKAKPLRLNGTIGMEKTLKLDSWRLQLAGSANAKASPRYVADVTGWDYQYEGDMAADSQALDVKSAPGNSLGADGQGTSKTGAATGGAPSESLADRFNKMAQAVTHKRHQGDAEAGPSESALNIGTPGLLLTMADLMQLPKVEHVFEFHCIEGWSEIVQWGGVRLRDLIDAYPPEKVNGRDPKYVYMETPDGNYYGGYDLNAARHPQSLLVTEMGGQPLTQEHGAPLRLFMPLKYGYKNLKRVGLIAYTDQRPDDYWTKLGYDWYAGL